MPLFVPIPSAACAAALALGLALGVDRCWGEPPARWHPVVWMGRALGWGGARVAPPAEAAPAPRLKPFVLGATAWWAGGALVFIASAALQWAVLGALPGFVAGLLLGLALKPLLAWRMLREEVAAVQAQLEVSLDAGRAQLARLVSRDTAALDAAQVREGAIESLAENLGDSLVAPLFWFVLLGLPGAALYRFANTADAMWGYHGARDGRQWEWAGKWAARADDLLCWLPARLSALLLAAAAGHWPRGLRAQAALTPSPNGGWPMAAMALLLGRRLGKPGAYQLNAGQAAPQPADLDRALRLAGRAVAAAAVLALLALLLGGGPLGFGGAWLQGGGA